MRPPHAHAPSQQHQPPSSIPADSPVAPPLPHRARQGPVRKRGRGQDFPPPPQAPHATPAVHAAQEAQQTRAASPGSAAAAAAQGEQQGLQGGPAGAPPSAAGDEHVGPGRDTERPGFAPFTTPGIELPGGRPQGEEAEMMDTGGGGEGFGPPTTGGPASAGGPSPWMPDTGPPASQQPPQHQTHPQSPPSPVPALDTQAAGEGGAGGEGGGGLGADGVRDGYDGEAGFATGLVEEAGGGSPGGGLGLASQGEVQARPSGEALPSRRGSRERARSPQQRRQLEQQQQQQEGLTPYPSSSPPPQSSSDSATQVWHSQSQQQPSLPSGTQHPQGEEEEGHGLETLSQADVNAACGVAVPIRLLMHSQSRLEASRCFFELLLLQSRGLVRLQQQQQQQQLQASQPEPGSKRRGGPNGKVPDLEAHLTPAGVQEGVWAGAQRVAQALVSMASSQQE
ncbi:hypothetical protein DUNSADRAFT_17426 [Dunaliella salina]|uniref:Uncharacterized protein n=1 Tax=Dunaliella salina TaxID=3046 RepID=A0ABQ7H027_DUNSA|nr:hypothetical protein DUNSADRAFT_17426 [Dunaliella salina]|eukprot:KAF5840209.1 hypothetical protein DUNSADRAFT_17426 [Dunaliella salina]